MICTFFSIFHAVLLPLYQFFRNVCLAETIVTPTLGQTFNINATRVETPSDQSTGSPTSRNAVCAVPPRRGTDWAHLAFSASCPVLVGSEVTGSTIGDVLVDALLATECAWTAKWFTVLVACSTRLERPSVVRAQAAGLANTRRFARPISTLHVGVQGAQGARAPTIGTGLTILTPLTEEERV